MMPRGRGLLALAMAAAAVPVNAEWQRVRTDHFVLTINDTPDHARDAALRLEWFDAALRRLYDVADDPDQPARPIAIWALRPALFADACDCPGVLGFYRPLTAGSFIFSTHDPAADRNAKIGSWSSQALVLHEYSHHFAFSHYPIAYPYWFSEGFAEFNANSAFEPDGSVVIGYPANYRAGALKEGNRLSPKQMFEPNRYGFNGNVDLVYGRGWLLTHYLMLNRARAGQLAIYLAAMNGGMSSLDAAGKAFGDLGKLNAELDTYARGRLSQPLRIPPLGKPLKVEVTAIPPGEAAMLHVYVRLLHGVGKYARTELASEAAKIAARFPDDAVAQSELADAEFYADHLDRADEAADRALKRNPDLLAALDRKGMIAVKRATDAKATDAVTWIAARSWFLKANRRNPNDPMPLYQYYASFIAAKAKPTAGAVKGLLRAQVVAPESNGIRIALARQMLVDGQPANARVLLQPIAFAPHASRDENIPRQALDAIDAGKPDDAKALLSKDDEKGNDGKN